MSKISDFSTITATQVSGSAFLPIVLPNNPTGQKNKKIAPNELFKLGGGVVPFSELTSSSWDATTLKNRTKTLNANTDVIVSNTVNGGVYCIEVTGAGFTFSINGTNIPLKSSGSTTVAIMNINGTLKFFTDVIAETIPAGATALTLLSSTGVTKTGSIYAPTSPGGTSWGNTILWNKKLPAGEDGYIEMTMDHVNDQFGMIGFKTTAVEGGYATFSYSAWGDAVLDALSAIQGGSVILNGNADVPNSYPGAMTLRLGRITGDWYIKTSTDNFSTSTTVHEFTVDNNSEMSPVSDIRGDGQLNSPLGFGLV